MNSYVVCFNVYADGEEVGSALWHHLSHGVHSRCISAVLLVVYMWGSDIVKVYRKCGR